MARPTNKKPGGSAEPPVESSTAPTTPAPSVVRELVARFATNVDAYKSGQYNETQLRREFLDPFFEALGWDISNKQGYAEAYKDVVHEDALRIGATLKAPDYSFRIGGTRKFFGSPTRLVEA